MSNSHPEKQEAKFSKRLRSARLLNKSLNPLPCSVESKTRENVEEKKLTSLAPNQKTLTPQRYELMTSRHSPDNLNRKLSLSDKKKSTQRSKDVGSIIKRASSTDKNTRMEEAEEKLSNSLAPSRRENFISFHTPNREKKVPQKLGNFHLNQRDNFSLMERSTLPLAEKPTVAIEICTNIPDPQIYLMESHDPYDVFSDEQMVSDECCLHWNYGFELEKYILGILQKRPNDPNEEIRTSSRQDEELDAMDLGDDVVHDEVVWNMLQISRIQQTYLKASAPPFPNKSLSESKTVLYPKSSHYVAHSTKLSNLAFNSHNSLPTQLSWYQNNFPENKAKEELCLVGQSRLQLGDSIQSVKLCDAKDDMCSQEIEQTPIVQTCIVTEEKIIPEADYFDCTNIVSIDRLPDKEDTKENSDHIQNSRKRHREENKLQRPKYDEKITSICMSRSLKSIKVSPDGENASDIAQKSDACVNFTQSINSIDGSEPTDQSFFPKALKEQTQIKSQNSEKHQDKASMKLKIKFLKSAIKLQMKSKLIEKNKVRTCN